MARALLVALYLLVALHVFQLTLLANAEVQEILPLILQGFLVGLWWDRAGFGGLPLVLPPPPLSPFRRGPRDQSKSEGCC